MTLLPLMCWAGCARLDQVRPADAQPTLNNDAMINSSIDVRFASGRISRLGIMMFPVGYTPRRLHREMRILRVLRLTHPAVPLDLIDSQALSYEPLRRGEARQ